MDGLGEGPDATPRPGGVLLWVHAASVGETASVLPVLADGKPTNGTANRDQLGEFFCRIQAVDICQRRL